MVQKKPSGRNILDVIREQAEEYNKRCPIIASRWYVIEVTPAYNTGGYYDEDIPEKRVMVSSYFETQSEAQAWMDQHEPDKGNMLKIQKENLRRITYERWELG